MFRIKFNKIPQHFRRKIREALVQSQVRFNRNPEKIPGRLDARPSQPQQDSNDNSGEVSKPRFRRKFRRKSGIFLRRARFRRRFSSAKSGSSGFGKEKVLEKGWIRFWKRFRRRSGKKVPEKVKFNRVPKNVPEKGSGYCRVRSSSTGFRKKFGRLWCRAQSGSLGFRRRISEVPEKG